MVSIFYADSIPIYGLKIQIFAKRIICKMNGFWDVIKFLRAVWYEFNLFDSFFFGLKNQDFHILRPIYSIQKSKGKVVCKWCNVRIHSTWKPTYEFLFFYGRISLLLKNALVDLEMYALIEFLFPFNRFSLYRIVLMVKV